MTYDDSSNLVRCPFCAEQIQAAAKKCRHCGEIVDVAMRASHDVARASGGAAAASSSSTTVVIRDRRGMNHGLHVLLCFITLGLWIPIYLILIIIHAVTKGD